MSSRSTVLGAKGYDKLFVLPEGRFLGKLQ